MEMGRIRLWFRELKVKIWLWKLHRKVKKND